MSDEKRTVGEPHDRLTRLCATMVRALEADPEHGEDVRCAIFLDDDDKGGLVLNGYDDDREAFANVFGHLRAILRVNGMDLKLVQIGHG